METAKMAPDNFSIGAFYNITKNQDNPIKTVGQDSFWAPKPPKYKFLGVTQPPGVAQPLYSRGHNYIQTYNICLCLIEIGSKTAEKNSAQTKNRQTNRHYENNGHLAVNQKSDPLIYWWECGNKFPVDDVRLLFCTKVIFDKIR